MGAKENGEEPELDSEPVRDPLSSQPETHLNGTKRATRVPKKIIKKEIIFPNKPSRVSSTKLQYNNKFSPTSNFTSPKRSPKPNNTINNNNYTTKNNLSGKKLENEVKEASEETVSTTSEETKEIVDILDEAQINNNNYITKRNLSGKKQELEVKEVSEETISITSEETKEIVDILDEAPNCDQSNSTDTEAPDQEEEQIVIQDQVHPNNSIIYQHQIHSNNGVIYQDQVHSNNGVMYQDQVHSNNEVMYEKVEEMERKMERMEMELSEAGIVEFAIYSVVSVHGGPEYKVHAPARRLCKVYVYACENWSKDKIGSLTRNVVSGLGLVAKSCGNDVSRLTFWLSNIIMLREKINQTCGDRKIIGAKQTYNLYETSVFISSLVKIESWIFSRIVESVWWQAITPPMQSKLERQSNNSTNLWINAFNNAFNKLCPISGGTHKCGCLKLVSKMVMEQCIERLDVAMFNAILRESLNELPTDPISDPISNPKVLPIPPGDFSFGSGAQLKNSIGNWSRYLNEILGHDVKESTHTDDDDFRRGNEEMKYFSLLNELSELLMLPKDMIIDHSIRHEVCPSFGVKLITRIVSNFEADEFCPDSVPYFVIQELNSECIVKETLEKNLISSTPFTTSPVAYRPPQLADVAQVRDKVAELDKKALVDDDLDSFDSSLSSIIGNDSSNNDLSQMNQRYKLLREIWS